MKKRKVVALSALIGVLCAFTVFGCSSQEDTTEEASQETQQEEEPEEEELKVIGTEAEGENVYKVILENNTGKGITGVAVKDSSMDAYPENMLAEGDTFAQGERRELYYDSTSALEAQAAQEADADAAALTPQYDIQLTFDDESTLVLTAFPFDDIEEGVINLEDEVAFITYTSVATKDEMSTKEAELAIKAQAEADAQAAAEAQAAAAAAAQQQQQQYSAPAVGGSNTAGCVDGGLLY